MPLLALLLACGPANPDLGDDRPGPGDDSGDADTDSDPVGGCAIDPALTVLSSSTSELADAPGRRLTVALSAPAALGVACAAGEDHLYWESPEATTHDLELGGFVPEAPSPCRIAPVCPRSPDPPTDSRVTLPAAPAEPATFLTNRGPCSGTGDKYAILYDLHGNPRWWHRLPSDLWNDVVVQYLGGGRRMWGGGYTTEATPHVYTLAVEDPYHATWDGWGGDRYTHEARGLPDGRMVAFA